MSRFIILIFFVFFLNEGLYAQDNLDSLYAVWQDESQTDSIRVGAYSDFIWDGYMFSNPDTAFVLAQDLLTYGERSHDPNANAKAYLLMGVSKYLNSDNPKALEYYQRSLKIAEEIGDKTGMASTIGNIGIIFYYQGDYPKALEYYQRSLKITEEIGDKTGMANAILNIGNIYKDQGDYPKALEYYHRSLKINEEIGDIKGMSTTIVNIGIIYYYQGDYPKALEYYHRSLRIQEEIGDKAGMSNALNNIGLIYQDQGDYPKALEYCKKALRISKEIGALNREKDTCQCLYDTYKAMGKGNEALVYLEKIQIIEDSLNAEETSKKLQQMEFAKVMLADSLNQVAKDIEVQNTRKEEIRKSEKTRNILLGSGLFLLLLAGGFFSRWRYVKKSRDIISKEKDRSDNLLLNILPAEIAEELKAKGEAVARDFDQVSILFTDFKEFTQMSEKLSAKELVGEINHCFKAFDGICEKYDIEKIKTIGDSFMAAGGLPVPKEDSVKNTVLAALEMTAFIIKRKVERENAGQLGFEMRAGIHTGNVVAGIVGVKKFQYDIWGDTVNTASRMESNGEIRRVNISQFTYDIVKNDPQFSFTSRGKVQVKGKGEVEMWFVESD